MFYVEQQEFERPELEAVEISFKALQGLKELKLKKNWWTWSGSNRRPLPCHGSALPTAPQAHVFDFNYLERAESSTPC